MRKRRRITVLNFVSDPDINVQEEMISSTDILLVTKRLSSRFFCIHYVKDQRYEHGLLCLCTGRVITVNIVCVHVKSDPNSAPLLALITQTLNDKVDSKCLSKRRYGVAAALP